MKDFNLEGEATFSLSSPISEEDWDKLTDVDLDNTDRIIFHTKHGKEVEFVRADAVRCDEWCYDCSEYDKVKHNCPRFNRVIRKALEEMNNG